MMNEHLTADQRSALAWGIADKADAARWMAHIDECGACRAGLEADRGLLGRLGEAGVPEPDPGRWEAALRAAVDEARPAPLRPAPAFDGLRAWAIRAAVLFVAFSVGFHAGSNRRPLPGPVADIPRDKPSAPALYRPAAPDNTITTASVRNRFLMVRSEDISRV